MGRRKKLPGESDIYGLSRRLGISEDFLSQIYGSEEDEDWDDEDSFEGEEDYEEGGGSGRTTEDAGEDKRDMSPVRSREPLTEPKEWRGLFPDIMVRIASEKGQQSLIYSFDEEKSYYSRGNAGCWAYMRKSADSRTSYSIRIGGWPASLGQEWKDIYMSCSCPEGQRGMRCIHKAAVLYYWEKKHGPFIGRETDEEYRQRMEQIDAEDELEYRRKLKEDKGTGEVPALSYFRNRGHGDGLVFFDLMAALESFVTTPYAMARAEEVKKGYQRNNFRNQGKGDIYIQETREGARFVRFTCYFEDRPDCCTVTGILSGNRIVSLSAVPQRLRRWYVPDTPVPGAPEKNLNEYALAGLDVVWDFLDQHQEQEVTDSAAEKFFLSLEKLQKAADAPEAAAAEAPEKRRILVLEPRIVVENGQAALSFRLGRAGERLYIQRTPAQLVRAYRAGEVLELSKKESIDFGAEDFREECMPLVNFVIRRIGDIGEVNARLTSKAGYGRRVATLSVSSQLELKGSVLDGFYDTAEGTDCDFQDKTNDVKDARIHIGHAEIRFRLKLERCEDARGHLAGIAVSGFIPVTIRGSSHSYTLSREALSRISAEERKALSPFTAVADSSGYFRFQVGMERMQEFYYRVLPALTAYSFVELEDTCGDEVRGLLPPEPEFVFYLDAEEVTGKAVPEMPVRKSGRSGVPESRSAAGDGQLTRVTARCVVDYDGVRYSLIPGTEGIAGAADSAGAAGSAGVAGSADAAEPAGGRDGDIRRVRRDIDQEKRVYRVLRERFGGYDREGSQYFTLLDEDELYSFLSAGVAVLSRYGDVQGTDAFRRLTVRRPPQITVGISVDSGIMDLTVTSKEFGPEELLELMASYRLKKRYHRLRSGDFVDLSQSETLAGVEKLLREMEVGTDDAIRRKVHLPAYRALYLDKLLEEHEELVSTRDRTFRALARNFRSVRDADIEAPESVNEVLRPYQSYGFKWLKTLENSGFGGILADEMGLGKTIQVIALLLHDKEQGNREPSLVVCPASLVYNWQEEIRRFAPGLRCTVLAGTQGARRKALASPEEADVFVTSYDSLKRDIALYEGKQFHAAVLDEAQYIKNARAAAAKSVKTIRARSRFALTGTPIENRLAELWSIFDFLMPGFLYSAKEFERRFEVPVTREKDKEAAERLKRMTSPFILRRLKEDVLKDLPAKLEEVRYARLAGEQQKLYDAQVVRMTGMLASPRDAAEAGAGGRGGALSRGEEKIRILAELTRIRQICCDPSLLFENYGGESAKREALMETVRSAIDGGHRMLVFSQFTSMLALIEEDLKAEGIDYYKITGSTPKEARLSMVHAFNEGSVPVFLVSLKAGGTGLNLTGADVVIHYDPWWNLAAQNQATDRAHRIGQTKQVTVYKLILKDTIEERIMELQNTKRDLAEAILEGEGSQLMNMTNEELLALLQ